MINNRFFNRTTEIEKDGKKTRTVIPGSLVLLDEGPVISVIITHPDVVSRELHKQNKEVKVLTVNGLIDTGASSCIVTKKIVDELQLLYTGQARVTSVQDEQERPQYFARFQFEWGAYKDVSVIECPLQGCDCIIGRNILIHWHLTYNGSGGFISICD